MKSENTVERIYGLIQVKVMRPQTGSTDACVHRIDLLRTTQIVLKSALQTPSGSKHDKADHVII